jgi:cysteine desulfurase
MSAVYLDWNATAPLHPIAREVLAQWLDRFGNASSRHRFGEAVRSEIEAARHRLAESLGVMPNQVVFTSSGTEGNNTFIKGVAWAERQPGTVVVSAIEHPSVREPAQQLTRLGWRVRTVAVDSQGRIEPTDWAAALAERPRLVSLMLANNETGVVQPVAELAREARQAGAIVHCDAVQGWGKLPIHFAALGVDALTLSGHKIGAPIGVGVLVIDRRIDWAPLLAGGGQEGGRRSGTENGAAIATLGALAPIVAEQQPQWAAHTLALQQALEEGLTSRGATLFSAHAPRLPNTTFFALPERIGESWVLALDREGFAVASGSACSSTHPGPSATLTAMGVPAEVAQSAIRVSTGWATDAAAIAAFLAAIDRLRQPDRLHYRAVTW